MKDGNTDEDFNAAVFDAGDFLALCAVTYVPPMRMSCEGNLLMKAFRLYAEIRVKDQLKRFFKRTKFVFILFQDTLFTANFTLRFIDGLNVKEVVNRIMVHRDLFNQGLWSLYSNFRFRLRAFYFFVSDSSSRTIW